MEVLERETSPTPQANDATEKPTSDESTQATDSAASLAKVVDVKTDEQPSAELQVQPKEEPMVAVHSPVLTSGSATPTRDEEVIYLNSFLC